MVAGGFLRDMIVGIPPKDLDLFVSVSVNEFPYVIEELLPSFATKYGWKEIYTPPAPAVSESFGGKVLTYEWDGLPIQFVVGGKSLSYILKSFDYSINQIWWSNSGLFASSAFMTTLRTGKVKQLNIPNKAGRHEALQSKLGMFTWPEDTAKPNTPHTTVKFFKQGNTFTTVHTDPSFMQNPITPSSE